LIAPSRHGPQQLEIRLGIGAALDRSGSPVAVGGPHRLAIDDRTRKDTRPMADLRFERFSDPAFLAHITDGEDVPRDGWAIRADGAVFCEGVQVGRSGKYVFNRLSGTPYGEIAYEGLDGG
jgi:hypothetical protein